MENYYYHGIESSLGTMGSSVQTMIKILKEGILVRNEARNMDDSNLNHVCLYKKNEDYSYTESNSLINSARGGWIDGGFVFVINPNIDATKAIVGQDTDLVDEWRCYHNIPVDDIVAIALPFEYIEESLDLEDFFEDEDYSEDLDLLKRGIKEIKEITTQLGLPIYDSCQENFTDKLDSSNKNHINNRII